jgi:hypothetical protein
VRAPLSLVKINLLPSTFSTLCSRRRYPRLYRRGTKIKIQAALVLCLPSLACECSSVSPLRLSQPWRREILSSRYPRCPNKRSSRNETSGLTPGKCFSSASPLPCLPSILAELPCVDANAHLRCLSRYTPNPDNTSLPLEVSFSSTPGHPRSGFFVCTWLPIRYGIAYGKPYVLT